MLTEAAVAAIVEAIFSYLLEESGIAGKVRVWLGQDTHKKAFQEAFTTAYREFSAQHPDAASDLFDEHFLRIKAAPILGRSLQRSNLPNATDLALAWAAQFGRTATSNLNLAALTQMASEFLGHLEEQVSNRSEFQELLDSRSLDSIAASSVRSADAAEKLAAELSKPVHDGQRELKEHLARLSVFARKEIRQTVLNEEKLLEVPVAVVSIDPNLSAPAAYKSRRPPWFRRSPESTASSSKHPNNFREAFESVDRSALLIGDAGSGKTTALLTLALQTAEERLQNPQSLIPFYVPISSWQRGEDILSWLARVTGVNKKQLQTEISTERAFLLLDGLDELTPKMPDPASTLSTIEENSQDQFLNAITQVKGTPILISCRVDAYQRLRQANGALPVNSILRLDKLTEKQVKEYLKDQPVLSSVVAADENLLQMARTPLLLTLLALSYLDAGDQVHQLNDLNTEFTELKDQIIRLYVKRRYEFEQMRSDGTLDFSLQDIYSLLGDVVFHRLGLVWYLEPENEDEIWDNAEFNMSDFLQHNFDASILTFMEFVERLHLMVPTTEGRLRFIHSLVRDHFVFQPCIDQITSGDSLNRIRAVYILRMLRDKRALSSLLLALEDSDENVQGMAAQALGSIGSEAVADRLIATLSNDQLSESVRSGAAAALANMRYSKAANLFIITAQDQKQTVRVASIIGLVNLGLSHVVWPSLLQMLRGADKVEREFALAMLPMVKDVEGIEAIISLLLNTDGDDLKPIRASLIRFGPLAVQPLLTTYANNHDDRLLEASVAVLANMEEGNIPLLIELLGDDNEEIRIAAAHVLKQFGSPAVPALYKALREGTPLIRTEAAIAIGALGQIESIALLAGALADKDERVREQAADSIVKLLRQGYLDYDIETDTHTVASLTSALDSSNSTLVRLSAAMLLGLAKSEAGIDSLIELLREGEVLIQASAAIALGRTKSTRAIKPLLDLLIASQDDSKVIHPKEGEELSLNSIVASVLAEYGELALDSLLDALKTTKGQPQGHIAGLLVEIGKNAVEPLINFLKDDQHSVQCVSIETLAEIADKRAIAPIISLFESRSDDVVGCALRAAVKFGADAIDPLIAALGTNNKHLQQLAAFALVELGDKAVDALIEALKIDNFELQKWVAIALGHIADKQAIGPLLDLLHSSNNEVCKFTAGALVMIGAPAIPYIISMLHITQSANPNVTKLLVATLLEIGEKSMDDLVKSLSEPYTKIVAEGYSDRGLSFPRFSGHKKCLRRSTLKSEARDGDTEVSDVH